MERKAILLLGIGVLVLAVALVMVLNYAGPSSGGSAGPARTALPTPATIGSDEALEAVRTNVQETLDRMDADTATAATALGPAGMNGNETREIVRNLSLAADRPPRRGLRDAGSEQRQPQGGRRGGKGHGSRRQGEGARRQGGRRPPDLKNPPSFSETLCSRGST